MKNQVCIEVKAKSLLRLFDENKRRKVRHIKRATCEKSVFYQRQVQVLHEAYTGTHELMDNGKASYLEVLTAQESLLSAQLSEAMNMYNGSQAVIALYIVLGGGVK